MKVLPKLILCLLVSGTASAQSLKPNENAVRNQSWGVRQEVQTAITFSDWGEPIDTCLVARISYNKQGLIEQVEEFHQCGEPLARQEFYYDARGRMTGGAIGYTTNNCSMVPVSVVLNENGLVLERSLLRPIEALWQKETYTYDANGMLIKSEQWQQRGTELKSSGVLLYPGAEEQVKERSGHQTHWYDDRGFLLEERLLKRSTVVKKIIYSYEYY